MSFDPDKPYNELPLLPLKAELETKGLNSGATIPIVEILSEQIGIVFQESPLDHVRA